MSRRKTEKTVANEADAQPQRRSGLRQLASASVLIVVLFAIYVISVSNRLEEMEQHSLDRLGQMTASVEALLTNSLKIVDSLRKPGYACEFFRRQTRLTLDTETDCADLNSFTEGAKAAFLTRDMQCEDRRSDSDPEFGLAFEKALTTSAQGFSIRGTLVASLYSPEAVESDQTQECVEKKSPLPVLMHVDLDEVLDATSFGTAFESVLIADASSDVISQHAPSGHALFQPPGSHIEHREFSVSIGNLSDLVAASAKDDAPAHPLDNATTSVNRVKLAGSGYTLMCQPLGFDAPGVADLSADDDEITDSFQVCGLINGGRSLRQSLEVASPVVLAMLAFVLLGIIAWPVVKLTTLRTRERMHFVEVYVAMLATIAILMVSTVLLLGVDRASSGKAGSQERLAHTAHMLEQNLMREFTDVRQQLSLFDQSLPALSREWKKKCSEYDASKGIPDICTCDENGFQSGDSDRCRGDAQPNWLLTGVFEKDSRYQRLISQTLPKTYPFLSQVFWMELCDGMQLLKASARAKNTPRVKVAKRDYYRSVRDDTLWRGDDTGDDGFFVQSFRSITTGEFSAALSTRSGYHWHDGRFSKAHAGEKCPPSASKPPQRPGLGVVLSLKPLSMINQVLAPGMSYAVIDNATGTAVFHADVRHATVENLFRDEGIADRLKAAVQAQATVSFDGRYRTVPHRIHVRPLQTIPWTIVVFESAEIGRTSTLEVLSQATLMVALHLLVLGLLTGVYLMNNGRETPRWIWPNAHWPHEDRMALYRGSCWWLLAWGLTALTAVSVFSGQNLWWAVAAPQFVMIVFLFAGAAYVLNRQYAPVFERLGRWVLITALLLCSAVSAKLQGPSPDGPVWLTAVFAVWLGLTLWWTRRRKLPIDGGVRWCILAGAFMFVGAIWALDSPRWALWCLVAFFVAYLMMPLKSWQHRLRGYQLMSTLVWLVIAVPPAVGYFKIAHERELGVSHELETDYINRARAFRLQELNRHFKDFVGREDLLFGANTRATATTDDPVLERESDFIKRAYSHYSIDQVSRLCYLPNRRAANGGGLAVKCPARYVTGDDVSTRLIRTLNRHFPVYNEMTRHARYADTPASGHNVTPQSEYAHAAFGLPIGSAVVIGSFVVLGLLWAWVAYGARRLFYGELDAHNESLTVAQSIEHDVARHTIATLATPAQYAFVTGKTDAHDVVRLSSSEQLRKLDDHPPDRPVLCTHLGDALRDDKLRLRVLAVLEKLAQFPQGKVIVITGVPIGRTYSAVGDAKRVTDSGQRLIDFPFKNDGESARWRSILTHYESVNVSVRGDSSRVLASKASLTQLPDKAWLEAELGAIAGLASLMGSDYECALTRPLTRREVIKEIGKRADWFYRSLWDNCTTDEKLVLTQLSREGVVNPRQANAVRSLLARGLLRMDPVLKPVNNSFGRYVASVFSVAEVDALESAGRKHGFNKRRALLGLILVVLLFLWFTQRDVVDTWITYLGAIAVGMTSVLKIMDTLKGGSAPR